VQGKSAAAGGAGGADGGRGVAQLVFAAGRSPPEPVQPIAARLQPSPALRDQQRDPFPGTHDPGRPLHRSHVQRCSGGSDAARGLCPRW